MSCRSEMRNQRKYINCPICGNIMLKCSVGNVEVICPKCRNTIVVSVRNEQIMIFRSRRNKEQA